MHALFLLGSTRRDGNTEQLARLAATSLPPEATQQWLRLDEHPLPPFVDVRHDGGRYEQPQGHARTMLEATLAATDLVFAAPTYWYSLPAAAKLYLDHFSGWMRVPGVDFKARMAGRTLWVITVNSDDPGADGSSAPLVESLRMTAEYLSMRLGGVLIGHANKPGEIEANTDALATARTFFSAAR
jgi:multimeric flavodoxin WrbA